MYRYYGDIISRIAEPPLWWEKGGIPRYDEFKPGKSTGIYTNEVALAEIACQFTGIRFIVAFEKPENRAIAAAIRDFSLFYGDPPNIPEVAGDTSSLTLRILQYWHCGHPEYVAEHGITDWARYTEWKRDRSLEVAFPDFDSNETPVYALEWKSNDEPSVDQSSEPEASVVRRWVKFWLQFFRRDW